jgi:hypothetical protein
MREWLTDALLVGLRDWSMASVRLVAVMNLLGAFVA